MLRKFLTVFFITLTLTGCSMFHNIDDYENEQPAFDFQEYFTGPVKAWGMIQDMTGKVQRRFDIDLYGEWDGNEGVLRETFYYYNGEEQYREWRVVRNDDGTYTGYADDVIGSAESKMSGNAINWTYVFQLPVNDRTYNMKFDDWMFLMNDGVLINQTKIRKFGITVGQLNIFMQKQDNQ